MMEFIKDMHESRMTRSTGTLKSLTYTDCRERLYLSVLILEALYQYAYFRRTASEYARRTTGYDTFKAYRMSGTDLYNFAYFVNGDEDAINKLKDAAHQKVNSLKTALSDNANDIPLFGDLSRPGESFQIGSRHPISLVKNQIIDIFSRIGFNVSEGPEIEDDWHNFTALNLPEHHPARDMQDTFFIDKDIALRTHTSSVQVRVMEESTPPIRTI